MSTYDFGGALGARYLADKNLDWKKKPTDKPPKVPKPDDTWNIPGVTPGLGVDALNDYSGSEDEEVKKEAEDTMARMPTYQGPAFPELKRTTSRPDLTEDYKSLRQALTDLETSKQKDYDRADNKELMVRAFDAFGKVLAGMYGNKAGVDVSGIKTELPDFAKTYSRIAEKYKDKAALEKEQAGMLLGEKLAGYKEQQDAEDFANRMKLEEYKSKAGEAEARYRGDVAMFTAQEAAKARVEAAKERTLNQGKTAEDKQKIADEKAEQTRLLNIRRLGENINKVLSEKDVSSSVKMGQVINLMQSNPATAAIPRQKLEEAFTNKGWFTGRSPKDADEILEGTSKFLNLVINTKPSASGTAVPLPADATKPNTVERTFNGRRALFDAETKEFIGWLD